VLAGALAALALALGFVTLAMNQTASHATVHTIIPLKDRHPGASSLAKATVKAPAKPGRKAPVLDPNFVAAKQAGLPVSVAHALAKAPVAVVEVTSAQDPVAELSATEAKQGAADAGAAYVAVNVDDNGGAAATLTRLLGQLPDAPATLVYVRPAHLYVTLPGFNDRTAVEQAAASAAMTVGASLALAPDWATQANELCLRTSGQLNAIGSFGDPKQLAGQKAKLDQIGGRFLAQFAALKPPAGEEAQVAHLNALLKRNFASLDAIVAAAARNDTKGAAATLLAAVPVGQELNSLERQLGATTCAEMAN
jgi:hypothetical protein